MNLQSAFYFAFWLFCWHFIMGIPGCVWNNICPCWPLSEWWRSQTLSPGTVDYFMSRFIAPIAGRWLRVKIIITLVHTMFKLEGMIGLNLISTILTPLCTLYLYAAAHISSRTRMFMMSPYWIDFTLLWSLWLQEEDQLTGNSWFPIQLFLQLLPIYLRYHVCSHMLLLCPAVFH